MTPPPPLPDPLHKPVCGIVRISKWAFISLLITLIKLIQQNFEANTDSRTLALTTCLLHKPS